MYVITKIEILSYDIYPGKCSVLSVSVHILVYKIHAY